MGPKGHFEQCESQDGTVTALLGGAILGSGAKGAVDFLQEFLSHGRRPRPPRVVGRFVAIFWDRHTSRLSVLTDRYGMQPVYVRRTRECLWLSTSLNWLRQTSHEPLRHDLEAIGEILTFKFVLGAHTLLQGVERLPAASTIRFESGNQKPKTETYWDAAEIIAGRRTALKGREAELTERFLQGVRCVTKGQSRVVLSLSGGLDSRVMLAAALNADVEIVASTIGLEGGHDHTISTGLCDRLGLEHVFEAQDESYRTRFADLAVEAVRRVDGMSLTDGTPHRWLADRADDRMPRLKLHGALGELARLRSLHHYPVGRRVLRAQRGEIADLLVSGFRPIHERILQFLNPDVRSELAGRALDSLRDRIGSISASLNPIDVCPALAITEYLRNSAAYSFLVSSDRFELWSPFLDPDYLDALLSIRSRDRLGSDLHVWMLRKLRPELLSVRESSTGCRPGRSRLLTTLPRLGRRISARLGRASSKGHSDYSAWIAELDPPIEERILHTSVDLFHAAVIRRTAADARAGCARSGAVLYRFLLLALWFQEGRFGDSPLEVDPISVSRE